MCSIICQSDPCTPFLEVFLLRVYFISHGFHSSTSRVSLFLTSHLWDSPASLNSFYFQPYLEKLWVLPMLYPLFLTTYSSNYLDNGEYLLLYSNWMIIVSRQYNDMQAIFERQWLNCFQADSMQFPHLLSCVLYTIKAVADFYFTFGFTFPKVCLLPAQMSVIIFCHFLHLLIFSSLAFFFFLIFTLKWWFLCMVLYSLAN